jgi:hypothetical protein
LAFRIKISSLEVPLSKGRLTRPAVAACLVVGMRLAGAPPARATSGTVWNGNGTGSATFDDTVYYPTSGWESINVDDTRADGLGTRAYVNNYYYYDDVGGAAGPGETYFYNFSEWSVVTLQACSRNSVNGSVVVSNWGPQGSFYA